MSASQDLRNAVDGMFRQTSPPTPPRVVNEALTSEEASRDNQLASTVAFGDESVGMLPPPSIAQMIPRSQPQKQLPEKKQSVQEPIASMQVKSPADAAFVSPAGNAGAVKSPSLSALPSTDAKQQGLSWWQVLLVIVSIVAAGIAVLYFFNAQAFESIKDTTTKAANDIWQYFYPSAETEISAPVLPSADAAAASTAPSNAEKKVPATPVAVAASAASPPPKDSEKKAVEQNGSERPVAPPKKKVRIDEGRNTVRLIPARNEEISYTALPDVTKTRDQLEQQRKEAETMEELLRVMEMSASRQTDLEMKSEREEAIRASAQHQRGSRLRLDEREKYSREEMIADAPIDEQQTRDCARSIYDAHGGNSVVGNAQQAPFVTFAPGEEPFDGMIPDYDEQAHGNGSSDVVEPLKAGESHSIIALVSNHCSRTGKPQPKPADVSVLDITKRSDTSTHAAMRAAEYDGHYLQSQRKQCELQRKNASAIKNIYAAKHASTTGQILDRGETALTSFAQASDPDAVQFLNINAL